MSYDVVCLVFVFSRNSPALEKAIWLMYLSTSWSVIPMPLSETVMVFCRIGTDPDGQISQFTFDIPLAERAFTFG